MTDLTTLLVGGVPLVAVIFGLVEFSKKFGLKDNWLTLFSLLLGLMFGMAYKIMESGMPYNFSSWFTMIVFGLALGLTASGLYDFANTRLTKVESTGVNRFIKTK